MRLAELLALHAYGTAEGAVRGWDTRGRSNHPEWNKGVHLTIFQRSKRPNQYLTSVKRYFTQPVPEPAEKERVAREFLKAKETGTERVNPREDVTPMQESLLNSRLERVRQGVANGELKGKTPVVFRFEGKQYVMDGHHRLAFESSRGRSTTVRVFQ